MNELDLLRDFRSHATTPPPGMSERIQEQVLQQVLEAEAAAGRPGRRQTWWWPQLARQGSLAVVAACIVVALSFSGGRPTGSTVLAAGTGPAGYFNAAASNVNSASLSPASPLPPPSPSAAPRTTTVTVPVLPSTPGELSLMAFGPAVMNEQQLELIPLDPRELLPILRATRPFNNRDADFGTFRVAAPFLASADVPAELRAAMLETLGLVDGLEIGGAAADPLGRAGVLVARLDGSGLRQQYLLDNRTAQLLELREYTTHAQGDCPADTVVALAVFDSAGFQVVPQSVPSGRWPEIVPSCG